MNYSRPIAYRGRQRPTALARSGKAAAIGVALGAALGAWAIAVHRRAKEAEKRNPPLGRFMIVDGVRLHLLDRGSGPPVVLLHGDGSMVQDFLSSGIVDRLAESHRVIAFDRPGYGYSERPRSRLWSAAAQADLFHAALERLGVEKPVVVGHSWGTLPAVELALRHPDAVGSLVLLSGHYYPMLRLDAALLSPPAAPVVGDAMRYTIAPALGRVLARTIIAKVFAPAPVPKQFTDWFPVDMALRPGQLRASAEDTAFLLPINAKTRNRYSALRHPVAILAGDGDRIVNTRRQSERLHRELPQSTFQLAHEVGHMIHQTRPDMVVAAIENAARKVERAPLST